MKKIIEILDSVRGCKFANLSYVTDGGIPKKVIDGKVTKLVHTTCQVNYNYENAVNNRLEKQGDDRVFTAQSLPWGSWVMGYENKLIAHKGNLYLRYYDVANATTKCLWFVDGRLATEDELFKIMEYIVAKNKSLSSKRQADAGLVENQVSPKVVKFDNIIRFAVNGMEYSREHQFATIER